MARKPINWKEPIWEIQEGEPQREANYKQQFLTYKGSLESFADYLLELWEECHQDKDKVAIYFDRYDIKKGAPPSSDMLKAWSAFYKWIESRRQYRNYKFSNATEDAIGVLTEYIVDISRGSLENAIETNEQRKEMRSEGRLSLTQDKAGSESVQTDLKTGLLAAGKATDKRESSMDANVDTTAEVKTDLQNNIQKYQEKLLDGRLEERTKNRFRKNKQKE